jgi:hypothetical protein
MNIATADPMTKATIPFAVTVASKTLKLNSSLDISPHPPMVIAADKILLCQYQPAFGET